MNLTIDSGFHVTTAAHAMSIMFFISDCILVSLIASPKHPQSFIGFAIVNHIVMAVIMHMNANIILEHILRLMANSMNIPSENSSPDIATDVVSVIQSGIMPAIPTAPR